MPAKNVRAIGDRPVALTYVNAPAAHAAHISQKEVSMSVLEPGRKRKPFAAPVTALADQAVSERTSVYKAKTSADTASKEAK